MASPPHPRLPKPTAAELTALVEVARGRRAATLYFRGGTVFSAYTGEIFPANVAVWRDRIAYVGASEAMVGPRTRVIDATGRVLVPGYIEPHTHPYHLYNPYTFCAAVLPRGTTTAVCDQVMLFTVLDDAGFAALVRDMDRLPLRYLWSIRPGPATILPGMRGSFPRGRIRRALRLPQAIQAGEFVNWPFLLDGDPVLMDSVAFARALGKRVDGHASGAGWDTLAALAAAGVTSCHESITADEVLMRLRLGLHAMLRHSSLRPDLPVLADAVARLGPHTARVMLTADGPAPPYLKQGYTDYLLRTAMEAGIDPVIALQMVTVNPATYFGLDEELGVIGPGRRADILVLRDVRDPLPEMVFVDGDLVAREGRLVTQIREPRWSRYRWDRPLAPRGWRPEPALVRVPAADPFPVMQLVNAAITRREDRSLPVRHGAVDIAAVDGLCAAVLVDRSARWVVHAVVDGLGAIDGLATSCTSARGVL
ncbi:MAG: adenine deaminase, partial [Armatimonadetes bacterium]|nr:adenine deaminase [Armatimonadota bacterium]